MRSMPVTRPRIAQTERLSVTAPLPADVTLFARADYSMSRTV